MTHTKFVERRDEVDARQQIQHLMWLDRECGRPQRFFLGADGFVKVYFNAKFYDYHKLEEWMPNEFGGWDRAK